MVANLSSCDLCPVGSFSTQNASLKCELCPVGTFANETGQSSCTLCPTGTVSTTIQSTKCRICPPGFFSNDSSIDCQSCAHGTYAPDRSMTTCLQCAIGSSTSGEASIFCDVCEPGFFREQHSKKCTSCLAGTYSDQVSATHCFECPAGSIAPIQGSSRCIACREGFFSNNASQECHQCVPGKYVPYANASDCLLCPAGSFSEDFGSTGCKYCTAGKVSPKEGMHLCSNCNTSQVAGRGERQCWTCDISAGLIPHQNQSYCKRCEIYEYILTSTLSCEVCPGGSFAIDAAFSKADCKNATEENRAEIELQREIRQRISVVELDNMVKSVGVLQSATFHAVSYDDNDNENIKLTLAVQSLPDRILEENDMPRIMQAIASLLNVAPSNVKLLSAQSQERTRRLFEISICSINARCLLDFEIRLNNDDNQPIINSNSSVTRETSGGSTSLSSSENNPMFIIIPVAVVAVLGIFLFCVLRQKNSRLENGKIFVQV